MAQGGILQGDQFVAAENEKNETNRNHNCVQHGDTSVRSSVRRIKRLKGENVLANHTGQTITIDSGSNSEATVVASTAGEGRGGGATITAVAPLTFAHAAGGHVSGSGITLTAALTKAHAAGIRSPVTFPRPVRRTNTTRAVIDVIQFRLAIKSAAGGQQRIKLEIIRTIYCAHEKGSVGNSRYCKDRYAESDSSYEEEPMDRSTSHCFAIGGGGSPGRARTAYPEGLRLL
jgi:hypothetical protein